MKRKRNLKNVKSENDKDIISLNEKCFDEFIITQLEERLETDPLVLANLLNMGLPSSDADMEPECGCYKIKDCPELKCGDRCPTN